MIHLKMRPDIRGNGNGDNYTWLADRLRAVSLFSVVRRAKRETRKWPRA